MARLTRIALRRLASVLPAEALAMAKSLRRSGSGQPTVLTPNAQRALVLCAHPDDETMMAGGTIALLASSGCRVGVVVATDGEATGGSTAAPAVIAAARRTEALEACRILGVDPPQFLGHADGRLGESMDTLVDQLSAVIAATRPEVVLAPWWLDGHPDHRSLCRALAGASIPDDTMIWLGEIWTPHYPNLIVDISGVIEQKARALKAHATAGLAFELDAMLGLNRFRSVFGLRGRGWAEAFIVLKPDALVAAVAGDG